jgi:superoxide reductase
MPEGETTMEDYGKMFQMADWKKEKHSPVIEVPAKAKKDEKIEVKVCVGKEIPHPNKTEHHICWITVYFHPEGEKFPYQVAHVEFTAHGASVNGPDTSTVYTEPAAACAFKTAKSGTVIAFSYCNIHGLWANSAELKVE